MRRMRCFSSCPYTQRLGAFGMDSVAGCALVVAMHLVQWITVVLSSGLLLLGSNAIAQDREPAELMASLQLKLARGEFAVRILDASDSPPRAVMVFGSGDGGWSEWENVVCNWLRSSGVLIVAMDMREYAKGDFSAEIIGKDMAVLAAEGVKAAGNPDVPVIYAGWSMGAVQVVPAAAW